MTGETKTGTETFIEFIDAQESTMVAWGGESYQEKIKRLEAENSALREVVEAARQMQAEVIPARLKQALDKLDEVTK